MCSSTVFRSGRGETKVSIVETTIYIGVFFCHFIFRIAREGSKRITLSVLVNISRKWATVIGTSLLELNVCSTPFWEIRVNTAIHEQQQNRGFCVFWSIKHKSEAKWPKAETRQDGAINRREKSGFDCKNMLCQSSIKQQYQENPTWFFFQYATIWKIHSIREAWVAMIRFAGPFQAQVELCFLFVCKVVYSIIEQLRLHAKLLSPQTSCLA